MAKQDVAVTELVDTDVQYVSLVKRGANRIPFRITKEDGTMIDLHKIASSLFRKADKKPEIIGAVVEKTADLDKVEAVFKAAGLDSTKFVKSEKDGIVTIAKSDAQPESATLIKVSPEVGLIVEGVDLKKSFEGIDFTSWSFADVLATEGYFSSVCTAVGAFQSTVANIMMNTGSATEAAAAIGKACDELKTYLTMLTAGLPVQAFKADIEFSKAGSLAKAESDDSETVVEKADETVKSEEATEAKKAEEVEAEVKKEDEAVADVKKEDAKAEEAKKEEPAAAEKADAEDAKDMGDDETEEDAKKKKADSESETAKADKDDVEDDESGAGAKESAPKAPKVKSIDDVLDAVAALAKSVGEQIAGVQKDVSAVSERIDATEKLAKKTDAALNGTVFTTTKEDTVKARKADSDVPLFDTAFEPRPAIVRGNR